MIKKKRKPEDAVEIHKEPRVRLEEPTFGEEVVTCFTVTYWRGDAVHVSMHPLSVEQLEDIVEQGKLILKKHKAYIKKQEGNTKE